MTDDANETDRERPTGRPVGWASATLDAVIVALLLALLVFTPLALGTVEPWSEMIAFSIGAAMAACVGLRLLLGRDGALRTWAMFPVLVFLIISAVQLVPLPPGVLRTVSPPTASMRAELLSDLYAAGRSQWAPLSFYPHATRHDLRLVLLATTAFIATLTVFWSARRIRLLLGAIAIIGGGLAALAVAQHVTRASGIYWSIAVRGDWWTGTFVNHTDFGQHINLCLGAALGLGAAAIARPRAHRTKTSPTASRDQTVRPHGPGRRAWLVVAAAAALVTACGVSLLLSRSRGAAVGIAGGVLVALVAEAIRRGLRTALLLALLLGSGIAGGVAMLGGAESVTDRLATLAESREYAGRLRTAGDVIGIWRQFPMLGTGLGTHETFYPRYDRDGGPNLSTHAENEFVQVAAETGLVGIAAVLLFAAIVWFNWGRCLNRSAPPICAAAIGLGYGLAAAHVQSLSSFGQHLPAIGCLTAVVCGLIVSLGRIARDAAQLHRDGGQASPASSSPDIPAEAARPRLAMLTRRVAAATLLVAAMAWAVMGAVRDWRADVHGYRALALGDVLRAQGWIGSTGEYADLIADAEAAVAIARDDVRYRVALCAYRWHALDQAEEMPGVSDVDRERVARQRVAAIIADLHDARLIAPTYGPTYTLLGQLELNAMADPRGADRLRIAALLSPKDPVPCHASGMLDARAGRWEDAHRSLRQVVMYDAGRGREILDLYFKELKRPDLAAQVAPDNPQWLLAVADRMPDPARKAEVHRQAVSVLEERCAASSARSTDLVLLAQIHTADGNHAAAAELYRRALRRYSEQTDWRLARARGLAAMGRIDEARREAAKAVELQPRSSAARKLVDELSRR